MNRYLKYGLIALVVVVVIVLAIIYFSFLGQNDPTDQSENPGDSSVKSSLFIEEPVLSPSLSFSGDTVWFFNSQGRLFRQPISGDEVKKEFALPSLANYIRTLWQSDGSNFIVEMNPGGHTQYALYDTASAKFVQYPDQLSRPQFVSGGREVVYDWLTGDGNHELKASDLPSTVFRTITELFRSDYQITASPAKQEVLLYVENQVEPARLFLVSLETGEFTNLSPAQAVQGVKFSPDGRSLLVANWDETAAQSPSLYLQNLTNLNTVVPGIFANIEQTAWSADGTEFFIADEGGIIKFNTITAETSEVFKFDSLGQFEPADILLHPTQPILFFVDKKTGFLYRVDL